MMERVIERPFVAIQSTGIAKSGARVLQTVVLAHIILVTFQFLIRALVFDTTFYRDALLILAVIIWAYTLVKDKDIVGDRRLNWLDRLVVLYIGYGLAMVGISLLNGVSLLSGITQFRNYFLPVALYFVAKKAFATARGQSALVNVIMIINILLIIDVIGEFLVQQSGASLSTIPWYPYMFKTGDRFIGNEVGSPGYILPENTPILGILGYPHYTVALLVAVFAFTYPFFIEKRLSEFGPGLSSLIGRVPVRVRQFLALLTILAVFILGVRAHLLSLVFVFMILPFFTQPKVVVRNLLILLAAVTLLAAVGLLEPGYLERLQEGFFSSGQRDSSLSLILSVREIAFIVGSPVQQFLFGNADVYSDMFGEVGSFELRLLFFTAAFGVVWLSLFTGVFTLGLIYARRIWTNHNLPQATRTFAIGAVGLLVIYLIDVGHYARTMFAPNIDIWVVCLGALSAIVSQIPKEEKNRSSKPALPITRIRNLRQRLEELSSQQS